MLKKTILILFLSIFLLSSGCTDSTEDLAGSVEEVATAAAEVSGAIEEIENGLNELETLNDPADTSLPDLGDMDENAGDNVADDTTAETPAIDNPLSASEDLRIGAFNIQVFGVTKESKPDVMLVIADIVRTYRLARLFRQRADEARRVTIFFEIYARPVSIRTG